MLGILADDESLEVRQAVARNPKTPQAVLRRLAETDSASVAIEASTRLTAESMLRLGRVDRKALRMGAGLNHQTPPSVLLELASDVEPDVRAGVAANPNTPPEALKQLIRDSEPQVRFSVACNPSASVQTLQILLKDPSSFVRGALLRNPTVRNGPKNDYEKKILCRLRKDPDPGVSRHARRVLQTRKMVRHPPTYVLG